MRLCAFLTLSDPTGYVIDDHLAHEPFRALGWEVEEVPWDRPGVDWGRYEAVVIRSTWDYFFVPEAFLLALAEIERSGTRLENSLDLVRWNLRKTYLRDLAERGVAIVPTVWRDGLQKGGLRDVFEAVGSDEVVVKPVVSANAEGAFRLCRRDVSQKAREVETYFSNRALLAQPFVRSVVGEGEYSLFYFNGEHSHTILKAPKSEDFRVQEEHGGKIRAVEANDGLRAAGASVFAALLTVPLYLRADLVRSNEDDSYWLMELELIEPSLYFRFDPQAAERFARAFDDRIGPRWRATA